MKYQTLASVITIACALSVPGLSFAAQGQGQGQGSNAQNPSLQIPAGVLTEQDKIDLHYLQEEEKLARDVYLTLRAKFNSVIFQNISESEQRHTDSVLNLLNLYQIPSVALSEVGKFHDASLQTLYNDLILSGTKGASEASLVGALVEEVDIADLKKMLSTTKNPDLMNTYRKLMTASERHLNSFVSLWKSQTGSTAYKAQVLSQADVDTILGCKPLTVSSALQIHLPHLKYKNMNLWATLDYYQNPANEYIFEISDYGVNIAETNCTSATLEPLDLRLKTPYATFKYIPSNDGKMRFSLEQLTP